MTDARLHQLGLVIADLLTCAAEARGQHRLEARRALWMARLIVTGLEVALEPDAVVVDTGTMRALSDLAKVQLDRALYWPETWDHRTLWGFRLPPNTYRVLLAQFDALAWLVGELLLNHDPRFPETP
jgi:hypothetical protein